MDPDQALFLTAHRLARVACGHKPTCPCRECEIIAKCLRADKGLQRAVQYVWDGPTRAPERQLTLDELVGDIR